MAMHMKLQMKLSQQLIMTPQLQQAIKLLQLSRNELEELIDQTLQENPVLEEGMDIDTYPSEEDNTQDSTDAPETTTDTEAFETAREEKKEEKDQDEIDWQQYVEQIDQFGGYSYRSSGGGGDDELPSLEATLAQGESLADNLRRQLDFEVLDQLEYEVGVHLIGNIEDDGYLVTAIRELLQAQPDLHERIMQRWSTIPWEVEVAPERFDWKFLPERATQVRRSRKPEPPVFEEENDPEEPEPEVLEVRHEVGCFVEHVLECIQTFEPSGVGARSLQECLLIQLRHAEQVDSLSYRIIEDDMDLLESKDLRRIARRQKQELDDVIEAYKHIMSLEPKPGRSFVPTSAHNYIIPDVYIYQNAGEYKVALNANGIPRLRINQYYRELCDSMAEDGQLTKEYIQEKIKAGQWLMKSIEQRQKTIYRVTKSILRFQEEFFDRGIHFLKPLVLKDVAENIDVHESTVSRITTNKYVHTPQGIFELKYFFTSGIEQVSGEAVSSKRIKDMIQHLVQGEDVKTPFTDLQIAEILYHRSNIKVARRTVAKYREALNILPSNKRKQLF